MDDQIKSRASQMHDEKKLRKTLLFHTLKKEKALQEDHT